MALRKTSSRIGLTVGNTGEKEAVEIAPLSAVFGWVGGRLRQLWENTLEKHNRAVDQR